jgi:hypothetical protein
MTAENVALAATLVGLISALAGWWRWGRPRIAKAKADGAAMRDAILGREPVIDSITGRELAPALPGIGVRMATTEEQMLLLTEAVAKIADSHVRLAHIETRVDDIAADVADLKAGAIERIMARAEAAQAWSAVEAAVKATPPSEIDE